LVKSSILMEGGKRKKRKKEIIGSRKRCGYMMIT
jgi:hypothetical protein